MFKSLVQILTDMEISIRWAGCDDADIVSEILLEADAWLRSDGREIWSVDDLQPAKIWPDIEAKQYLIAFCQQKPAGVARFQTRDERFWPDIDQQSSAFIHRVAVARSFAKRGISKALIMFAASHAQALGKHHLRLDCVADRLRLRALYEEIGFQLHSKIILTPHEFARYELPLSQH